MISMDAATDTRGVDAALAETEDDMAVKFYFGDSQVLVRRKFKRLKFLRLLTKDPYEALKLALADGEMERLEELDMDENALNELFEAMALAIGAGGQGNSGPSRR